MKRIIRFLTDCYQLMIVIGFIGSLALYAFSILGNILTIFIVDDIDVLTISVIAGGIAFATIMECMFLMILGGAAILVDIRNSLLDMDGMNAED